MSKTIPYLSYNGNTKEAMNFYKEALNGELQIMYYEGTPMETEGTKHLVMHSHLKFANDGELMASDTTPEQPVDPGSNFSILIVPENEKQGEEYFNKLVDGGTIIMPYEDSFWGSKFGMLKDKFGITWSIDVEKDEK